MSENPFSKFDFVATRIERYGLATVILISLFCWAKPHIDDLIRDHRQFLKSSEATQADQAKILAGQASSVQHVESLTERSAEMIRDIHGHLIRPPVAATDSPEESTAAN